MPNVGDIRGRKGARRTGGSLLPNHDGDPVCASKRTEVHWSDLVRGQQTVDLGSLSDPVLVREDGSYLYTLPSIVDDGDTGVTHVIRGDDHVTNTGVQIAIFQALGLTVPAFGHTNLLTTIDNEGLSKRTGALSLKSLREDGFEPMAVASLAVLVGLAGSIDAMANLDALGDRVQFADVSPSASKFDPAELARLNQDLVHAMPYADAAERLRAMGVPMQNAEAFWGAVRANCAKVADAATWNAIVFGDLPSTATLSGDDHVFTARAAELLPPGKLDETSWKTWTDVLKAKTGRKGKILFMPLRLALTGLDHGPELAGLLPLVGRDRVLARLKS